MKLSKVNEKEVIEFVTDLVSNPYGFAEYIDQTIKLEDGWNCQIIIKQEDNK